MPLIVPRIDNLSYEMLRSEALARIPVHTPEWTNFNRSDPGVTIIDLFAFMTDNLLYRSNLIPERNRLKFLQLLGIPLQAATAAQGLVAYSNPRGPLRTETLPTGLELYAGQVPFRAEDGLDVLPIEAQIFYKSPITDEERIAEIDTVYQQLYGSHATNGEPLQYYETRPLEAPASGAVFPLIDLARDTVDGLWVALLARPSDVAVKSLVREAIANKVLTLGILPGLQNANKVLPAGDTSSAEDQPSLIYQRPLIERDDSGSIIPQASYVPFADARPSGNLLNEPGAVQLTLPDQNQLYTWDNLDPLEPGVGPFPPSMEDTDLQERVLTWVRIRVGQSDTGSGKLRARLSWVGINVSRVTQRVHVPAERLSAGTGEPDQVVTLINTPVITDSLQLTVNGERWEEIDDLIAAGSELPTQPGAGTQPNPLLPVRVYTLDRESGEIRFGDGAHGARPPAGAAIRAAYDYGGGRAGNVGIGAIKQGPRLPAGIKVSNPLPTWGGDEQESVSAAEKRIPQHIQHRDRCVTVDDFREITLNAPGVDIGRVEILPLYHPDMSGAAAEGVVTIMVIPRYDPVDPAAPTPDQLFLDTICLHLNPRRLITTEIHVRGPEYEPLWLSIGIDVVPGQPIAPVREAVKTAVRTFLSPLRGGLSGSGWPLEKSVEQLEMWAVAARVTGVAKVTGVLLSGESGEPRERITLTGLQLPRLAGLAVQAGDPLALSELRGETAPAEVSPVPVPILPDYC